MQKKTYLYKISLKVHRSLSSTSDIFGICMMENAIRIVYPYHLDIDKNSSVGDAVKSS